MASALINDSQTWERAMSNYYHAARKPWLAAVHADYRHCCAALVLGVDLLLKHGVLQVAGAAGPVANAQAYGLAADGNIQLARRPAEFAAGDSSADVAAKIAEFIGLTKPDDPASAMLPRDAAVDWKTFAHKFAEALYYTAEQRSGGSAQGGINVAVEFGASWTPGRGANVDAGRHADLSVKTNRIGSMVRVQANHTAQAVSAYAQGVEFVNRWSAGTALSGSPNGRSLLYLHH